MTQLRLRLDELIKEKEAALGREISQKEIAQETGLQESTISRYRKGFVSRFDADVLYTLRHYFNVDYNALFVEE